VWVGQEEVEGAIRWRLRQKGSVLGSHLAACNFRHVIPALAMEMATADDNKDNRLGLCELNANAHIPNRLPSPELLECTILHRDG
jgi:hypothetical protein